MSLVIVMAVTISCGELRIDSLPCMTLSALELCQIAQINRMFERPVSLVAIRALEARHLAQVNRMIERPVLYK